MKFLTLILTATLFVASPMKAGERAVLVELFTSQGCSSCPPADAFLHKLAERDDVVALALHVDYWDYIGWKDSFAKPEFAARQRAYARLGNRSMIYTPQMVINGRDDVVGSNPMDTNELIEQHKKLPVSVDLSAVREGGQLMVWAQSRIDSNEVVSVYLMPYNPKTTVEILRGENAGRTFSYANVVTDMLLVAEWDMRQPLDLEVDLDTGQPAVIVLQRSRNGAVEAALKVD